MASSVTGILMPWFTVSEEICAPVTAGTDIYVSDIAAVLFNVDVNITFGNLPVALYVPAGKPIGIKSTTETIRIDVDTFMFAMAR